MATDYLKKYGIGSAPKKNPAPRIGTARPKRKSQATGKAPSKRLVQRRLKNTKKGVFPNPAPKNYTEKAKNYIRENIVAAHGAKTKMRKQAFLSQAFGALRMAQIADLLDNNSVLDFQLDIQEIASGK